MVVYRLPGLVGQTNKTDLMNEQVVEFYLLDKPIVSPDSLQIPKAIELLQTLQSQGLPFAQLVNCFRIESNEFITVDIQPETPQYPVHDIRTVERVAIGFNAADTDHPAVLALRRDFPVVPHINLIIKDIPRSLCLYQTAYSDMKPSWTAAALLKQLYWWLSQTARGELHAPDQPLEQAFYASPGKLVLPSAFFSADVALTLEPIVVRLAGTLNDQTVFVALPVSDVSAAERLKAQYAPFVYTTSPRVHGLIQEQPRTLAELNAYMDEPAFMDALRQHLISLKDDSAFDRWLKLLIIVRIPQQRSAGGEVEAMEIWTFASEDNLVEIGTDLGIWVVHENTIAPLWHVDTTRVGQTCQILMLNPIRALTREMTAAFNGLQPTETRFVAIGAGSLGSQVVNNLLRAGQGNWVWVDEDQYLPHNAARHYLPSSYIGQGKALAMASLLGTIYEKMELQAISANVLLAASDSVRTAFTDAEVILDMSASVAVARHLSLGVESSARRASLFLNPSGTDVVLLAEGPDRSLRLDHLEMEYYRGLIRRTDLQGHLLTDDKPIRYSHACRDVSVQLPQDQVALHAAIGARAIRTAVEGTKASVKLWRSGPDLSVMAYEIECSAYAEISAGNWTVAISHQLLHELSEYRQARLPNETGGVLVGVFDTQHRRIYIVDQIPSPPDSKEWPTAYYRGVEGVPEELERISTCTGRQVVYAGEWHSHPDQCPVNPSDDDREVFNWLQYHQQLNGFPPLMVIAGEQGITGWYVSDLVTGRGDYKLSARTP